MFRLLYLAFFGERRDHGPADHGHGQTGHGARLHDAPPAMALVLVVLAIGSVAAGYVGLPTAIVEGGNRIEAFLAPSFRAPLTDVEATADAGSAAGHHAAEEAALMAVSTLVALAGIGVATVLFRRAPDKAAALAARFSGVYRFLSNKYYVDELYDAIVVQPIKRVSSSVLWRGVDAGLIDGTVNGVGLVVRGWSAVLRRVQTGSVRAYAMSLFVGAVSILGYYLWR
jgi:NADH-quinone oxidoreductase subunit L